MRARRAGAESDRRPDARLPDLQHFFDRLRARYRHRHSRDAARLSAGCKSEKGLARAGARDSCKRRAGRRNAGLRAHAGRAGTGIFHQRR